eukprot:1173-Heterococcus_DN1.PRE.1
MQTLPSRRQVGGDTPNDKARTTLRIVKLSVSLPLPPINGAKKKLRHLCKSRAPAPSSFRLPTPGVKRKRSIVPVISSPTPVLLVQEEDPCYAVLLLTTATAAVSSYVDR